jgi:AraC family transcriptional regulator
LQVNDHTTAGHELSMAARKFPDTFAEIARIQAGRAPPVIPEPLSGGTRVTGQWRNVAFDSYVPGLKEHVIVGHFTGVSDAWTKTDGRVLEARSAPGSIDVIPAGHDGWRRASGNIEVSNVFLSIKRLQACSDQIARGQRVELVDRLGFDDPKLFTLLQLLNDEISPELPLSRLFMEQLIDLICTQLLRSHSELAAPDLARPRRGLAPWRVRQVISAMRERLADDIGLDELAAVAGLSRFHFCSAFRLATGQTPHQCLTALRMERARQLLADPARRIIDIALEVGYQTPSAFAVVFRRVVGVTPTEFRRRAGARRSTQG